LSQRSRHLQALAHSKLQSTPSIPPQLNLGPLVVVPKNQKALMMFFSFLEKIKLLSTGSACLMSTYCVCISTRHLFFLTFFTRQMNQQDPSYPATSYANSTASGGCQAHIFNCHTDLYLEEVEHHRWQIQIKSMNDLFDEGWTLRSIHKQLNKDPTCTINSLSSPSDHNSVALRQGPL
jgi:hypothetical protein